MLLGVVGCLCTSALGSPRLVHAAPLGATPAKPSVPIHELAASTMEDEDGSRRVLTIAKLRIVGVEQVSMRQVKTSLTREGLEQGKEILWPSDPRVDAVRDRLRATGYFRRVTLRLDPVEGTTDRVVLVVDLEERPTVSIDNLYLGSSRATPFRGGLAVSERNFLGRGVQIGGALLWSTLPTIAKARRQQSYKVFAEAPRLADSKVGVLGSAYLVSASEPYRVRGEEDDPNPSLFNAADYDRIGGMLGLTFPVMPELRLGVDYRFERLEAMVPEDPFYLRPDGEEFPIDLGLNQGSNRLTAAHFGFEWDGRELASRVGKGGRFALDVQVSSPFVGSQYEYVKIVAGGAYTIRLPWRHWLTPKAQGGQITGSAPLFERFYSGDLGDWTPGREQSLRFSTRNPIDVFGSGVDKVAYGVLFARFDLEYVWPLFRRVHTRGVYGGDFFISTGVYTIVEDGPTRERRRAQDDSVAPIGFNADLGLRLDTAIGTLNITVGNILRRTPL